ncbi:MAG: sigma-70 family RNA polymerase sigma factor [Planctomycetota bacterium]
MERHPPPLGPHDAGTSALNDRLLVLARRLVQPGGSAEDLVQDAWVASLERGHTPEGRSPRWMGGVVRNLAFQRRVQERRRRDLERLATDGDDATVSTEAASDAAEFLRARVAALGDPYSAVLRRRFFDGASADEIGAEMGVSPSTVRSQLSRGVQRLRKDLDERHGGRDAWRERLAPLGPLLWTRTYARRTWVLGPALLVAGAIVATVASAVLLARAPKSREKSPTLASAEPTRVADRPAGDVAEIEPDSAERVEVGPPIESGPGVNEATDGTAAAPAVVLELLIDVLDEAGHAHPRATLLIQGPAERSRLVETTASPCRVAFHASDVQSTADDRYVTIAASAPDAARTLCATVPIDVEWGTRLELRTRGPAGAGRIVVRDVAGDPVAGAVVTLDDVGRDTTPGPVAGISLEDRTTKLVTDEGGAAAFAGEPRGVRQLHARAPGYSDHYAAVDVAGEASEIAVLLRPAGTLTGRVRRTDGMPVPGVSVRVIAPDQVKQGITPPAATTDADGAFVLAGLRAKPEYVFATLEKDGESLFDYTIADTSDGLEHHWEARIAPTDGLALRFVSGSGEPLGGRRVMLSPETAPVGWAALAATDADGIARFRYVPDLEVGVLFEQGAGDIALVARHLLPSDHASATLEVVVADEDESVASVQGTLTAPGGIAAGAFVTGFRDLYQVRLEVDPASGRFASDGLTPGTYAWFVVTPQHGAHVLGEREVEEAALLDLGAMELPEPASIEVDWGGREPTSDAPWAVELVVPGEFHDSLPLRSIASSTAPLRLLPGRYFLRRGGHADAHLLEVPAGAATVTHSVPAR